MNNDSFQNGELISNLYFPKDGSAPIQIWSGYKLTEEYMDYWDKHPEEFKIDCSGIGPWHTYKDE